MTTPTVYRWDDANAPVARGERASLIDILTACLVTGYGAKAAAGWTREWEAGGTKAVFRNSPVAGTGFFLRVDSVTPAVAYDHNLAAYEIMSDIDSGTGPFTPTPLPVGLAPSMRISSVAGTAARPWVLIADERAFYLFVWNSIAASPAPSDANYMVSPMFFGDLVPRIPTDGFACGLKGTFSMSTNYYNFGYFGEPSLTTYQNDIIDMPRPLSGAAGSPQRGWGVGGNGPCLTVSITTAGSVYSPATGLLLARPYVADRAEAYNFRAFLPGVYQFCHQATSLLPQLGTFNLGDDTFLTIKGTTGAGAGWWALQLTDWWV